MATTEEHIEGLIADIWHAKSDSSVTNIMVARVLDWLNKRADHLQSLIEQGKDEWNEELKAVRLQIQRLEQALKGVNTVATAAHGRADSNARNIDRVNSRINAIVSELIRSGHLPSEWESGISQDPVVSPEHVDRGAWKSGETYYACSLNESTGMVETSHVWYKGCKYRCLATGTTSEPLWNSPDWMFEEGDPEPHLVITGGDDSLIAFGETKNIDCRMMLYNQDVTDDVEHWEITRDTGSETEDTAWSYKDKVKDFDGNIDLEYSRTENDLGYEGKATFRVAATLTPDIEVCGIIEI